MPFCSLPTLHIRIRELSQTRNQNRFFNYSLPHISGRIFVSSLNSIRGKFYCLKIIRMPQDRDFFIFIFSIKSHVAVRTVLLFFDFSSFLFFTCVGNLNMICLFWENSIETGKKLFKPSSGSIDYSDKNRQVFFSFFLFFSIKVEFSSYTHFWFLKLVWKLPLEWW